MHHLLYIIITAACLLTGKPFSASAQMKSCCEPAGTVLVSSVPQTPGTLRMVHILDSINKNAKPEDIYVLNTLRADLAKQKLVTEKDPYKRLSLYVEYCTESLNAGNTDESINVLQQILSAMGITGENFTEEYKPLFDLLAISYMRKGELENCAANHNPQSCILPIQGDGIHKLPSGSEQAIGAYKMILNKYPNDLQSRYLLNVAYMTLGKYPAEVPRQWLIEPTAFTKVKSTNIVLKDVGAKKGVDMNGLAGGCVVEDLDNDGLLDIMASSSGLNDQVRYMRQQKDGTFKTETVSSGLVGITGGLNMIHADYNNDGLQDIVILRGGWLGKNAKYPFSLIKNNGNNNFEDITIQAGLYSPAPTQTASWADFNNDGWLDLFVAHEKYPCQLFLNEKGKFRDVAPKYGLNVSAYVKGCIWGDINNDGFPDLYISILGAPNRLWINKPGAAGERTFEDISKPAGVEEPLFSFPSWFFDFDNDGWQDLFVSGYGSNGQTLAAEDAANEMLGQPYLSDRPRLYRNNQNNTFTDVSKEYSVDQVSFTMGSNFGDIDNDGWVDYYLGTGAPPFSSIVPNKFYRNVNGKKFEDITYATNTGHIQKGHGVAFADIDNDGDLDVYEVMGGAFEGDHFRNVLYENSSVTGNHWIKLKLEGVVSNRAAIGARVRIKVKLPGGNSRNIYQTVNTGGSFGSNPLMVFAGLGNATAIEEIEIKWPNARQSTELIKNVEMDRLVTIKEGTGKQ